MSTSGMFSTSEGYDTMSTSGMFSTSEGYHEYIRGDIVSTSGDVQYIGGNHDTCGGIP